MSKFPRRRYLIDEVASSDTLEVAVRPIPLAEIQSLRLRPLGDNGVTVEIICFGRASAQEQQHHVATPRSRQHDEYSLMLASRPDSIIERISLPSARRDGILEDVIRLVRAEYLIPVEMDYTVGSRRSGTCTFSVSLRHTHRSFMMAAHVTSLLQEFAARYAASHIAHRRSSRRHRRSRAVPVLAGITLPY